MNLLPPGLPAEVYKQATDVFYRRTSADAGLRAAIAHAYSAGINAGCDGGKVQWGVRRVGFRSVRVTSEQNGRWLLRQWVVPGELVTRHVSLWLPAATDGGEAR